MPAYIDPFGGAETQHLDYKASTPFDTNSAEGRDAVAELARDMAALANTDGGLIVLGVDDAGKTFSGVQEGHLHTWDPTKVGDQVNRYIEPPIRFRFEPALRGGATFLIIRVLEADEIPHVCRKGYTQERLRSTKPEHILTPGRFYFRTPSAQTTYVKNHAETRSLFRQFLSSATSIDQSALDVHTEKLLAELDATDAWIDRPRPRWVHLFHPTYTGERRFTLRAIESALARSQKQYRYGGFIQEDRHFPGYDKENERIIYREPDRGNFDGRFQWIIEHDGRIVVILPAWEARKLEYLRSHFIELGSFAFNVIAALDFLLDFYGALGVEGELISWEMRLEHASEHSIQYQRGALAFRDYRVTSDRLSWRDRHRRSEWHEGRKEIATEILHHFLERVDWPPEANGIVSKLIENV